MHPRAGVQVLECAIGDTITAPLVAAVASLTMIVGVEVHSADAYPSPGLLD
jgi:hypothetical protein